MNDLQLPTHDVCNGCARGEMMTQGADMRNQALANIASRTLRLTGEVTSEFARALGPRAFTESGAAMVRNVSDGVNSEGVENTARAGMVKVVCPKAGKAACGGTCQAKQVPAFPGLQK